jgi:hypothetical protein
MENQEVKKQEVQVQEVQKNELQFAGASFSSLAKASAIFAKSSLVPTQFQGSAENCFIAMEMSQRMAVDPMMVMQHLYVVNGTPAWSSQFIIAMVNSSGKFTPLQFKVTGKDDDLGCVAYAKSITTGELCESIRVTIKMAKDEGWYQKNGSKWKTMPELMLRYRSASFFGKFYCPEKLMGMATVEEAYELPQDAYEVVNDEIKTNANTGEVKSFDKVQEKKVNEDAPKQTKVEEKQEEPKPETPVQSSFGF